MTNVTTTLMQNTQKIWITQLMYFSSKLKGLDIYPTTTQISALKKIRLCPISQVRSVQQVKKRSGIRTFATPTAYSPLNLKRLHSQHHS